MHSAPVSVILGAMGHLTWHTTSPEQTAALARGLAPHLRRGDTILLDGPIGAGKTHFARNLIQSLLLTAEDVPSPTFTLVQCYDTRKGELWHSDLYRLTAVDEVIELGLVDAFEDAICLVEWPDRLGDLAPQSALNLTMGPGPDDPDTRRISAAYSDPKWDYLAGLTENV